jgi:DNA polymerase-3 subunit delta
MAEMLQPDTATTILARPSEPTLFGAPPVLLLQSMPADLSWAHLEPWLTASQTLVISVERLDGRQKLSKELLAHPKIQRHSAEPPVDAARLTWVKDYLTSGGVTASQALVKTIVDILDPPPSPTSFGAKTTFNTELARHELDKLIAYVGPAGTVTAEAVTDILTTTDATIAFDISTAVAERNRAKALLFLERYVAAQAGDTAGTFIQLSALLAEQFRSLLLLRDCMDRRVSDAAIMAATGYKSGRIFVLKKLAAQFTVAELQSLLQKLQSLDFEMKTGGMPAHVVLDLIFASLSAS